MELGMNTEATRLALHQFIDSGDDQFVKLFYEMAKAYVSQKQKDQMIKDSEKDIKQGRTHSLSASRKIIESWDD